MHGSLPSCFDESAYSVVLTVCKRTSREEPHMRIDVLELSFTWASS